MENKSIQNYDSPKFFISQEERLNTIIEHLNLMIEEKGEYVAIREMRKHISGYTKNLPNSSRFREEMNKIEDKERLVEYVTEYILNIIEE